MIEYTRLIAVAVQLQKSCGEKQTNPGMIWTSSPSLANVTPLAVTIAVVILFPPRLRKSLASFLCVFAFVLLPDTGGASRT